MKEGMSSTVKKEKDFLSVNFLDYHLLNKIFSEIDNECKLLKKYYPETIGVYSIDKHQTGVIFNFIHEIPLTASYKNNLLPEEKMVIILRIARTLQRMWESKDYSFRHIKPSNIFLSKEHLHVPILGDKGMVTYLLGKIPSYSIKPFLDMEFSAPELFKHFPFSAETQQFCDVYGLGKVGLFLFDKILQNEENWIKCLFWRMTHEKIEMRPSFKDVINTIEAFEKKPCISNNYALIYPDNTNKRRYSTSEWHYSNRDEWDDPSLRVQTCPDSPGGNQEIHFQGKTLQHSIYKNNSIAQYKLLSSEQPQSAGDHELDYGQNEQNSPSRIGKNDEKDKNKYSGADHEIEKFKTHIHETENIFINMLGKNKNQKKIFEKNQIKLNNIEVKNEMFEKMQSFEIAEKQSQESLMRAKPQIELITKDDDRLRKELSQLQAFDTNIETSESMNKDFISGHMVTAVHDELIQKLMKEIEESNEFMKKIINENNSLKEGATMIAQKHECIVRELSEFYNLKLRNSELAINRLEKEKERENNYNAETFKEVLQEKDEIIFKLEQQLNEAEKEKHDFSKKLEQELNIINQKNEMKMRELLENNKTKLRELELIKANLDERERKIINDEELLKKEMKKSNTAFEPTLREENKKIPELQENLNEVKEESFAKKGDLFKRLEEGDERIRNLKLKLELKWQDLLENKKNKLANEDPEKKLKWAKVSDIDLTKEREELYKKLKAAEQENRQLNNNVSILRQEIERNSKEQFEKTQKTEQEKKDIEEKLILAKIGEMGLTKEREELSMKLQIAEEEKRKLNNNSSIFKLESERNIKELLEKNKKAELEKKELEEKCKSQRTDELGLIKEMEECNRKLRQAEEENMRLNNSLSVLQQESERTSKELVEKIKVHYQEQKSLEERLNQKLSEEKGLIKEKEELSKRLNLVNEENMHNLSNLKQEVEKNIKAMEKNKKLELEEKEMEAKLNSLIREKGNLNKILKLKIEEEEAYKNELKKIQTELKNKSRDYENQVSLLEQDSAELQQEIDYYRQNNANINEDLKQLQKKYEAESKEVSEKLLIILNEMDKKIKSLEEKESKSQAETDRCVSEIKRLETLNEKKARELDNYKRELEEKRFKNKGLKSGFNFHIEREKKINEELRKYKEDWLLLNKELNKNKEELSKYKELSSKAHDAQNTLLKERESLMEHISKVEEQNNAMSKVFEINKLLEDSKAFYETENEKLKKDLFGRDMTIREKESQIQAVQSKYNKLLAEKESLEKDLLIANNGAPTTSPFLKELEELKDSIRKKDDYITNLNIQHNAKIDEISEEKKTQVEYIENLEKDRAIINKNLMIKDKIIKEFEEIVANLKRRGFNGFINFTQSDTL